MNLSEENKGTNSTAPPTAVIQKKKGISIVWIVPLVALFIAAGLVYKTLTEKGAEVRISFDSAEGLEAGKTKIKYKDVEIGEVESVSISPDLKKVIVTAQMVKEVDVYLTEETRFWVVRARLSGGIASGLGTLFSGSYIAMDPGHKGALKKTFQGLEIPPVVTSDLPGRTFHLEAPSLGGLDHGSPVYFKGIRVGQVVGYEFSAQAKDFDIKVFINAPYDQNVFDSTRFWFSSGLDMVLDANGVRIDTQSFVSMMIGGLAFANPNDAPDKSPAEEGSRFLIYDTHEDAMAKKYARKDYYLLKFDHSVRGLNIGAPVEFRGFPIGQVLDIGLETDWENNLMEILVKIEVEHGRIKQMVKSAEVPADALEIMVKQGMRAQLKIANIITGSMFVAIDFFDTADPASIVVHDDMIEIPTIPASLNELTGNLTALLEALSKMPFEDIGSAALDTIQEIEQTSRSFKKAGEGIHTIVSSRELKKAMESVNLSLEKIQRLTSALEKTLPASVKSVSKKTIQTLDGIEKLTASDSAVVFELKRALKEFAKTAQSVSRLADQLERHPESILQGKGKE